ncbi:hypothetical protein P6F26_09410 [Roseibacterium sp. SDUM158017]|uniref:hypothetical protein n=1 Tax=Roseicyclus salinarum TaxID=3036773 RepID=UPI0024154263|nr:hypothetical protein [Roseibacterium sp. SDUM158017]MDG4648664.1 hypothetical protein [Roseibacterium sp. SDUM158017]
MTRSASLFAALLVVAAGTQSAGAQSPEDTEDAAQAIVTPPPSASPFDPEQIARIRQAIAALGADGDSASDE